jgi:hypothetical protein
MKLDYFEEKYYNLVMFEDTTIAALSKDGQLYLFEEAVIRPLLEGLPKDKQGWFFNTSLDRYCAEWQGEGRIAVNPSKVYALFGMPVLF